MKLTLSAGLVAASAFALTLAGAPSEAHAQVGGGRNFGLGLALGFPNVGISANIIQGSNSIQLVGALRYRNYSESGGLFLRGDYLFYPAVLTRASALDLKFYVGPGVNLGLGLGRADGFYLGAELPVGLAFQFRRVPIDIGLEAVPVLTLLSSNEFGLGFGIGGAAHIRYYF
ncbi:MAG: hypothetical protein JNK72_01475 [Myxococcales bacterium]|nr:hypothetical protein [Myxococcales bacterium]